MAQVLPSACCHHPQNIYHTPYIEEHFDEIVKESIAVSEKVCKLYDGIVADDRKGVYKFTGDINSTWLYQFIMFLQQVLLLSISMRFIASFLKVLSII